MTRIDYVLLAQTFKDRGAMLRRVAASKPVIVEHEASIMAVANALASHDPRFVYRKFLVAAGVL